MQSVPKPWVFYSFSQRCGVPVLHGYKPIGTCGIPANPTTAAAAPHARVSGGAYGGSSVACMKQGALV